LALAPSWGRADDVLSLDQPAEAEGIVVVLDDAKGVDPDTTDDDAMSASDDIVVLPDDTDEPAEGLALVEKDFPAEGLVGTDEARGATEVAAPALVAQASTDVADLLTTVTSPTVMYRTHVQT